MDATAGPSAAAALIDASAERTGGRWNWPTDPPHRILKSFQAPATRYSPGHRGIDIATVVGAPVYAPADAEVYFSGVVVDRPVVTLQTTSGVLISVEPVLGTMPLHTLVHARDVVGAVGSGGHCDPGCVHLGVRVRGEYVSPLLFLGGAERAVLLPLD